MTMLEQALIENFGTTKSRVMTLPLVSAVALIQALDLAVAIEKMEDHDCHYSEYDSCATCEEIQNLIHRHQENKQEETTNA